MDIRYSKSIDKEVKEDMEHLWCRKINFHNEFIIILFYSVRRSWSECKPEWKWQVVLDGFSDRRFKFLAPQKNQLKLRQISFKY